MRCFWALWLFCVLLLGSCRHQEKDNAQIFRLNLSGGSLESMDPAYAKDLYTMWTTHMLYNTLVETDSNLFLQASLAKSWDISDDGLRYTFHLRDDVYFQDHPLFSSPRKMTAADVVYSFSRIIDPELASSGAWIFNGHLAEKSPFSAPDDTTFVMQLAHPFRPMLAMLSMPYCSIVPREVVTHFGKDFRAHPCGTGPFQFAFWDEGNVLVLHKNKRYWEHDDTGRALPYLDALQLSFYDSKATEFLLFLQGKIDFTHGLDGSFKDLVLRKDGRLKPDFARRFHLKKGRYLNTEYLGFLVDTANPLLKDAPVRNRKFRQAVNYAIDRQKISTYFKNGIGIPATGGFTPPGLAGFDSVAAYGYHYDPVRAAQLLREAGYPEGRGLKELVILAPENFADIVNFVVTQLKAVNIPARLELIQPNILKQQMSRSQAICFRAQWIADYPDAETYLAFFNSRFPAPPNYTRYHNPYYDKLYDQSMNLPDTLRYRAYRALDSIAVSDAPLVPLFYDQYLHFTQNRVRGFAENPMNLIDLKRVWMQ